MDLQVIKCGVDSHTIFPIPEDLFVCLKIEMV